MGSKSISTNSLKQKETVRLVLNTRLSSQFQNSMTQKLLDARKIPFEKHDIFAKFLMLFLEIWRPDSKLDEI